MNLLLKLRNLEHSVVICISSVSKNMVFYHCVLERAKVGAAYAKTESGRLQRSVFMWSVFVIVMTRREGRQDESCLLR